MKRLSAVVLLLLCLAGCAAPRQEAAPQTLEVQSLSSLPSLPAALHLACRMEAGRQTERETEGGVRREASGKGGNHRERREP